MLPAVVLLGFVNVWLMVEPDAAEAPVIEPVLVPNVQAKVLVILAVRLLLGPVPLQVAAVVVLVTLGAGLTVIVILKEAPMQAPVVEVGVTV
jgi:hypothetical protein